MALTNVGYKLLTKALAMRTEKIVPKPTHEDQSGFVKGRYIGENKFTDKAHRQRITGLILLLGFEKRSTSSNGFI